MIHGRGNKSCEACNTAYSVEKHEADTVLFYWLPWKFSTNIHIEPGHTFTTWTKIPKEISVRWPLWSFLTVGLQMLFVVYIFSIIDLFCLFSESHMAVLSTYSRLHVGTISDNAQGTILCSAEDWTGVGHISYIWYIPIIYPIYYCLKNMHLAR